MMYYIDWLASTLPQKGSTTISRKKRSTQHTCFYPQNSDWMVCVCVCGIPSLPDGAFGTEELLAATKKFAKQHSKSNIIRPEHI